MIYRVGIYQSRSLKDVTDVKTYFPQEPHNDWLLVDAKDQTVGRLATQIAQFLRGKHKVDYTPNQPGGDFIIVINAKKIYTRYSGYQGGLKEIKARDMLQKRPERVIERAVWGMLPKNRLGRKLIRRLIVYAGSNHPHQAQKPVDMELS